ncbi:methionine aminopeptidase-like [Chironomus tepperi]|uniref:methionine aminopeptidase-like n=1 Tax=Chironomus tepperi TaxID=113505 RepID=UPI00391F6370
MLTLRKFNFNAVKTIKNSIRTFVNVIYEPGEVESSYVVPDHIVKPSYYTEINKPANLIGKININNENQIKNMRKSCKIAANILEKCHEIVKPGISTHEIDRFVFNEIIKQNCYPSPLYYCGYPKAICTSVNNVACHGIPDSRKLMDGDIINIDITVFHQNCHGDCSKTFLVGNVDDNGRYLVYHNEKALYEAIKICRPGVDFREIGKALQAYANRAELNIVQDFIGHGIGEEFHCPPEIYHFENDYEIGTMEKGMIFTIEPIFSEGAGEIELWEDEWTVSTIDNSRTSQHEHTVLINEDSCEILTMPDPSK